MRLACFTCGKKLQARQLDVGRRVAGAVRGAIAQPLRDHAVILGIRLEALAASMSDGERKSSPPGSHAWHARSSRYHAVAFSRMQLSSAACFVRTAYSSATTSAEGPIESNRVRARIFWMGSAPLQVGGRYRLKLATQDVECHVVTMGSVMKPFSYLFTFRIISACSSTLQLWCTTPTPPSSAM